MRTIAVASLVTAACAARVESPSFMRAPVTRAAAVAPAEPAEPAREAPVEEAPPVPPVPSVSHAGPAAAAGGTCTLDAERAARNHGLVGPCWDPPGHADFAPPVHVVPGMRKIDDERYWFDMPREATFDRMGGCVEIPAASGRTVAYTPYAEEDGRPVPRFPPLTGLTLDEALAAVDALDVPLCVTVIEWSMNCDSAPGTVCGQNFERWSAMLNLIVKAAD